MSQEINITYKLNQWPKSNYEIEVEVPNDVIAKFKTKILKHYQKDFKKEWFRVWKVPLNIIEESIDPNYIKMWVLEEVIYFVLQKISDEKKELKLIGSPYDLSVEKFLEDFDKDWNKKLSFKIDVYPEVKELNKNYEKIKAKDIKIKVTDQEVEEVLNTMMKSYAEYVDADKVSKNSLVRCEIKFKKWDKVIHTKKWYLTLSDQDLDSKIQKKLDWLKKWDTLEIDYDPKYKNPYLVLKEDKWEKPEKIEIKIEQISNQVVPELTDDWVAKKFANEKITTVEQLKQQIKKVISENKLAQKLEEFFADFVAQLKKSFECKIPKTFEDEEYKNRIKQMYNKFWWEQWFNAYLKKLWEWKAKAFLEEIRHWIKESLENLLVLVKYLELKKWMEEINIQANDYVLKLYQKLTGKKYEDLFDLWEKKESSKTKKTKVEKSENSEKKEEKTTKKRTCKKKKSEEK